MTSLPAAAAAAAPPAASLNADKGFFSSFYASNRKNQTKHRSFYRDCCSYKKKRLDNGCVSALCISVTNNAWIWNQVCRVHMSHGITNEFLYSANSFAVSPQPGQQRQSFRPLFSKLATDFVLNCVFFQMLFTFLG